MSEGAPVPGSGVHGMKNMTEDRVEGVDWREMGGG